MHTCTTSHRQYTNHHNRCIRLYPVAILIEWIGQPQLSVIKVVTAKATRTNDLLRVQAEVLNEGSANQQLYYRFRWLDKEGFVVGGEEVWKPVIFYSNQKRILDTVAPTQDVEDFKIEMSTPK